MRTRTQTIVAASLLAAVGTAAAQQPRVAIAAAASSSLTDCRYTDVQSKLLASGQFLGVDILNVVSATPTLAELQQYDAVITWSNVNYQSGDALGNVLADYVDAGGGVVVAVFANAVNTANRFLGGRWQDAYEVILDQSGSTTGAATLGTILDPTHPLVNGVSGFSGGSSSFRPTVTTLASGATAVAQWSDGRTLLAVGSNPKRVDLGFYPPSNACSSGFWTQGTDGDKMLVNAMLFVSGDVPGGCYANCDQSTTAPILNVADFSCFLSKFAAQDPYANCDESTVAPVLNVADFSCFLSKFAAGCP